MDMYEERDDKRRPQVSGLCLKAFGRRGGGLGSPEAYCARFYFGSHVFWSLAIWTLDGSADKAEACVVPVLRLKQIYDSSAAAFRDQRGDSSLPPEITEVGREKNGTPHLS